MTSSTDWPSFTTDQCVRRLPPPYLTQTQIMRLLLTLVVVIAFLHRDLPAADIRFNEQIRPILAENCLGCHGPDANKRAGDLRLDLEDSAKLSAIVSGKPDESELFKRIASLDPDLQMPPPDSGKKLTTDQVAKLKGWIEQGASYEGHWAYEPVGNASPPPATMPESSDIDRFIIARLQSKGLTLSPSISRQQWIRRASLDLIGLPPSWEEVNAFVSDASPQAFEKVIDRLLDSPRYGERWGRHWLDIARYADTLGGSAIGFTQFPFSYTYRDYVIAAFNSDVPYDRFVTEQIAADQLGLEENHPALAGLGFLTVGMQYRNRHDVIDDQIDVVSRGLLGLTVACARCHDHKYDAIPTDDYYALYATFASSQSPDRLPLVGSPAESKPLEEYQAQLADAQERFEAMSREQSEVMRGRLRMQVGMYLTELVKGTPEQDLSSAFLSYRTDDVRPLVLDRWRAYIAKLSDNDAVFGPWRQLSKLAPESFAAQAADLLVALTKENGEPVNLADMKGLTSRIPKWNPLILNALAAKPPQSMLDVAEVYGSVLGEANQSWLKTLQDAAAEAKPGGEIFPDEDDKHLLANSPMHRQLRRHLYATDSPAAVPEKIAASLLNRTVQDSLNGLKGAIHSLDLSAPGSPPRAMALQENPNPASFFVFKRGNPLNRGEPVEPRFLKVLSHSQPQPYAAGKRRLQLAQSIVAPDNPLTRRVIVNWVWQQHFGQGLVRTPDDFGTRGRPPTHPALLDYLATEFLQDGWSIKKLHRRIMLTAVYGQAAVENERSRVIDPENELLWRMPRRRLELEAMRDSMLAVSGELDASMGGRPIDLQAIPAVPRRSVYGFVNRDIVSSLSSTFDGANPNACTAKRPDTSVPQQALFALNSEFVQDRALKLAALAEASVQVAAPVPADAAGATSQIATDVPRQRIEWLYERTYCRRPDDQELQLALQFINVTGADGASQATRWQQLAHVLLAANEFVFVD